MPTHDVLQILKGLPHFRLVSAARLEALAAHARLRRFAAQDQVFAERTPAVSFYAVVTGGAKLLRRAPGGQEQVINVFLPGHSFAEAAALSIGTYPVSCVATESPTELLEIPADAIRKLVREDEGWALEVEGAGDLTMERLAALARSDHMTEVFGRKLAFREAAVRA